MKTPAIIAAALFLALACAACAPGTARKTGREVGSSAREAGRETKELGKDVGHGFKELGQDIGQGFRDLGKGIKEGVKNPKAGEGELGTKKDNSVMP